MTDCAYHCRRCGRHFASLRSFDKHHQDGECEEPNGDTIEGVCRIDDDTKKEGVTIHR